MFRLRIGIALVLVSLLTTGWLLGQDKKGEDKTPPVKVRGTLPSGYGKLGLRDDQKQRIYKIRGNYRGKIEALQRQIDQLKVEERAAIEKVLTPEQLKRLRELRGGGSSEAGKESAGKSKTKDK
jgi:Spy/CpxP family protein refolding chaperone